MLCLSGFELYSRWVPLMRYRTDINLKSSEARLLRKKKKVVICTISLKPATKTISPHLSGSAVAYTSYINSQK